MGRRRVGDPVVVVVVMGAIESRNRSERYVLSPGVKFPSSICRCLSSETAWKEIN